MDCRVILTIALAIVLVGIIEEGLCGVKRDKRPVTTQRNRGKHQMSINVVTSKTRDWKIKLRPLVQKAEEHVKSLISGIDDNRNPPAFDYPTTTTTTTKRTVIDLRTFSGSNVYVLIGIVGLLIVIVISCCVMCCVFVRWFCQKLGRRGHGATVTAQFTQR